MDKRCLVGLIGRNIMRSLAPALHEDAFAAAGIIGHYHLMDADRLGERATLERLLEAARVSGFAGTNVTFPFKEAILPLLDAVSPEAREIGAVNTVVIGPDGRTTGYNTDRIGFRRGFEEALGRAAVDGRVAVLVGAGGAGRAVAFALFDLGVARLEIHDMDAVRAEALAADLACRFGAGRCRAAVDLPSALKSAAGAVNATPLGMPGHAGMAIPAELIASELWIADVVYTPLETALIASARARGCRVMTGGGMCVHQAAEAFRLFTGLAPDIGRMHALFDRIVKARDAEMAKAASA
jgi:shikimate dehydrogenase